MNKYHYSKGLSLIEVLVIIAIIGIFATLGTQGYQSIVSGSTFGSNKTEFLQYLNDVRHKSFSEKKHHRIQITNDAGKVTIELYEPIDTSLQWRDIDFVRSCAWQYIEVEIPGCEEAFCNSNIDDPEEYPPITGYQKIIEKINIKKCDNQACQHPSAAPVNICYLFDGTVALSQNDINNIVYVEIKSTSDSLYSISEIYKTGYVN